MPESGFSRVRAFAELAFLLYGLHAFDACFRDVNWSNSVANSAVLDNLAIIRSIFFISYLVNELDGPTFKNIGHRFRATASLGIRVEV